MATIAETVVALAPVYTGDARIAVLQPLAVQRVNVAQWGTLYTQGVAYLILHMLVQSDRSTSAGTTGYIGAGPVASLREGQAAVGYGQAAGLAAAGLTDASLTTTPWGLEYLALRATLPSGLWVTP